APVLEANLENELGFEAAVEEASDLSTESVPRVLPTLAFASLPVERNRSRLKAAAIAATVLVLAAGGAVIGGFAYNTQLDKQYAALALQTPPMAEPSLLPTLVSETEPTEGAQSEVVDVTAPATETSPRPEKPQSEVIKNEPAPSQP